MDEEDTGLVILKVIHEDGEDLLSTPDSEEEAEAVYQLFMEELFEDEDEEWSPPEISFRGEQTFDCISLQDVIPLS